MGAFNTEQQQAREHSTSTQVLRRTVNARRLSASCAGPGRVLLICSLNFMSWSSNFFSWSSILPGTPNRHVLHNQEHPQNARKMKSY